MTILFLHNKYLIGGGEDVSVASEVAMLRYYGHDVDVIYLDNKELSEHAGLVNAINTIWSKHAYRLISNTLDKKKYDLVHMQNFFPQFSPSVFYAIKSKGVKLVMSIRNYRLMCSNALLFVNDQICERCIGKMFPYPALRFNCYKKSFAATAVTSAMLGVHNLLGTWRKQIDGFITISDFVKRKMLQQGFGENKLFMKYNFVDEPPAYSEEEAGYYIYIGRLSIEKGIDVMLSAFQQQKELKLKVVGDGPLRHYVEEVSKSNSNIEYVGRLELQAAYQILREAKALVFPSKWNEPFGRTAVEAFAAGVPVIAAKQGGLTELVDEGGNGMLFDPFAKNHLNESLALFESKYTVSFRKNARKTFERKFTREVNYQQLMDIYNQVLNT